MNNTWLDELSNRHQQAGALLDANLLVLWIVGTHNVDWIKEHRRLTGYRKEHYDALRAIVSLFPTMITTPHVLTEASNLAAMTKPSVRRLVMQSLGRVIEGMEEKFESARALCETLEFPALGLADAAVAQLARQNVLVLTDDGDLLAELERNRWDAISIQRLIIH